MSKIFYIADPHFGHFNIIKYCNRPFTNIKDMELVLIKKWNSVVSSNDKIYIVGDFSIRGKGFTQWYENLLKKLNGRKVLVLGNHDYLDPFQYVNLGFESVHTSLALEDKKVLIAHDPALAVCMPSGWRMICGHIHNSFKILHTPNIIVNVGVDVCDFFPMSEKEVEACFDAAKLKRTNNGK